MEDYIRVSIQVAVNLIREQRYSNPQIAKILGVTALQVHYYSIGKTKTPKPKVCMKLYKNFKVEGKSLLLNIYKNFNDLQHHYSITEPGQI